MKFREFENVSGDLSADEIRRLYANKMTELRDNARGNSQALENLKKDKEEEKILSEGHNAEADGGNHHPTSGT